MCHSRYIEKELPNYRKWSRKVVKAIFLQAANVIKWNDRFLHDTGGLCKATIDCTDLPIYEQVPFISRWYSFKFNGPGLRCEGRNE
jgi:hypothetical protein